MKVFARWRMRVWDRRLKAHQKEWHQAIDAGADNHLHPESLHAVEQDVFYERLVTHALRKRTKWRKRAGVRRVQGGPVAKGRPYIRGEAGPELFIPTKPGRKVSPPSDRPKP